MGKGVSVVLMIVVLMAVSVGSQQAGSRQQSVQSHVVPLKKLSKLAMDKRLETGERFWAQRDELNAP